MIHIFGVGAEEMISVLGSWNLEPDSWTALDGVVCLLGSL